MFVIHTVSPLDEQWAERDAAMETMAECRSKQSGTSGTTKGGVRWHLWYHADFNEALLLKQRLESIPEVKAYVREK